MIRNYFLSLFIAIISLTNLLSQNSPKEICEKFFETFTTKGSSQALDQLYLTNHWVIRNQDAITKLKNQIEGLNIDYVGKLHGFELITEKVISNSFVLRSYMMKYDRQPIRFTFQFYKPDNEWKIHAFQYDSELDTEIEESAKLYYPGN